MLNALDVRVAGSSPPASRSSTRATSSSTSRAPSACCDRPGLESPRRPRRHRRDRPQRASPSSPLSPVTHPPLAVTPWESARVLLRPGAQPLPRDLLVPGRHRLRARRPRDLEHPGDDGDGAGARDRHAARHRHLARPDRRDGALGGALARCPGRARGRRARRCRDRRINALHLRMPPPPGAVDPIDLQLAFVPAAFAATVGVMAFVLLVAALAPVARATRISVVEARAMSSRRPAKRVPDAALSLACFPSLPAASFFSVRIARSARRDPCRPELLAVSDLFAAAPSEFRVELVVRSSAAADRHAARDLAARRRSGARAPARREGPRQVSAAPDRELFFRSRERPPGEARAFLPPAGGGARRAPGPASRARLPDRTDRRDRGRRHLRSRRERQERRRAAPALGGRARRPTAVARRSAGDGRQGPAGDRVPGMERSRPWLPETDGRERPGARRSAARNSVRHSRDPSGRPRALRARRRCRASALPTPSVAKVP